MRSALDLQVSTRLFAIVEALADLVQIGRPVPAGDLGDLGVELREIAVTAMGLEGQVRAADLLSRPEFRATVASLPVSERRALARSAPDGAARRRPMVQACRACPNNPQRQETPS